MPGRGEPGPPPRTGKAPYSARRAVPAERGFAATATPLVAASSSSSQGDRNNSAGGGEKYPGTSAGISPGAVMTPSRGAIKPRSLRSSPHRRRRPLRLKVATPPPPPPLLRPAAASCTNPLGPSCKSNAPSRLETTCAAGNGAPSPPPESLPGGTFTGAERAGENGCEMGAGAAVTASSSERTRLRSPPSDSSGNCVSPLSQEAIRREGGAEPANKRLRPPAGINAGTATGFRAVPGRERGGLAPAPPGLCAGLPAARRGRPGVPAPETPHPRGPGSAAGTVR